MQWQRCRCSSVVATSFRLQLNLIDFHLKIRYFQCEWYTGVQPASQLFNYISKINSINIITLTLTEYRLIDAEFDLCCAVAQAMKLCEMVPATVRYT